MLERHLSQIVQNTVDKFDHFGKDRFNIDEELARLRHPVTNEEIPSDQLKIIEERVLEKIEYRRVKDTARLIPVSVISNPKLHEKWFEEWLEKNDNETGSYYWKRLENYLSIQLSAKYNAGNAAKIIGSIDNATREIMSQLANPKRSEFSYKGLVLGYVQSGKTANFTALIAKAADAGYKFIIVLAGIHNILRRQTQIRLDKELTGMNDMRIEGAFIDEPSDLNRWVRITTARIKERKTRSGEKKVKDIGEFDVVNVDHFDSICNRSTPTLAIVKKNTKVLDRLIEYIENSNLESRKKLPLLVIDDEADQASIDTNATKADTNPTKTNNYIRRLLGLFPRKAYVGYTATPFANVLIDMNEIHSDLEDDLYPRNFIISLPKPEGYFGTEQIFTSDIADYIVSELDDHEKEEIIDNNNLPEGLLKAIMSFLLSCCIRNLRGDRRKPMSMLVHISQRIYDMKSASVLVNQFISDIKTRYEVDNSNLQKEIKKYWKLLDINARKICETLDKDNFQPEFSDVWSELDRVLQILKIVELNSTSDDRLDYSTAEELKVIALGGNQLSRGLTLEGLLTSYYLRDSRQYDTLLQMGRWFGYRHGYEDLTRIFTLSRIWDSFEHLALVEEELRNEVTRYENDELTPADYAVAIRDHSRLKVTSANKLGAGKSRQTSYSKSLNQTLRFPLDKPDLLKFNLVLFESFIKKVSETTSMEESRLDGAYISSGFVSGELVLSAFLNKYYFDTSEEIGGSGIDSMQLIQYIQRRMTDNELSEWKIAIVGRKREGPTNKKIKIASLDLIPITRSRLNKDIYGNKYNVGVLTDKEHLRLDLSEDAKSPYDGRSAQRPLLLLYIIASESKARIIDTDRRPNRVDLFHGLNEEKVNVAGFALVLPRSTKERDNYIGQ